MPEESDSVGPSSPPGPTAQLCRHRGSNEGVSEWGGNKPFENANSADWADMIAGLKKGALETRLGIRIIYGSMELMQYSETTMSMVPPFFPIMFALVSLDGLHVVTAGHGNARIW